MMKIKKPYLIIPKLIEQPTWGGDYITKMKGWNMNKNLIGKKIGQSYELFSGSLVAKTIVDSQNQYISPFLGTANTNENTYTPPQNLLSDLIPISEITSFYTNLFLVKINQAQGNSFQIHIRSEQKDSYWKSKPESWYYLENGTATYGIKKNIDINSYRNVCKIIDKEMKMLSKKIKNKLITHEKAVEHAKTFIHKINPWQFVNIHEIQKDTVLDLSAGGVHHSWEENIHTHPYGNVLYEIQKDVMDPVSTIRAFDQGKINNDGSIREINIESYFKYLDIDPKHNLFQPIPVSDNKHELIHNSYYCLNRIPVSSEIKLSSNNLFTHLFIRSGKAKISGKEGFVILTQGHSCFVPEYVNDFTIAPLLPKTVILQSSLCTMK